MVFRLVVEKEFGADWTLVWRILLAMTETSALKDRGFLVMSPLLAFHNNTFLFSCLLHFYFLFANK